MAGRLDVLDDPAYTTGRAAEILGVRQAFLRSLDAADAVTPQRATGGRRRYSRRQLAFAARIRELPGQGHTLAGARRILAVEDDLTAERALTARLHEHLAGQDPPGGLTWGSHGPATRRQPAGDAASGSVLSGPGGRRPVPAAGPVRPDHPGPRGRQAPQHPGHQQRHQARRHRLAVPAWAALFSALPALPGTGPLHQQQGGVIAQPAGLVVEHGLNQAAQQLLGGLAAGGLSLQQVG
jgi:MerR family transcriptional regulator, heat shock protein HspR